MRDAGKPACGDAALLAGADMVYTGKEGGSVCLEGAVVLKSDEKGRRDGRPATISPRVLCRPQGTRVEAAVHSARDWLGGLSASNGRKLVDSRLKVSVVVGCAPFIER